MDGHNEKVIEKSGQLGVTTPVHKHTPLREEVGNRGGGGGGVYGGLD